MMVKKWYVEYKVPGKAGYTGMYIEATDGTAAIAYVRAHVIGAYCFKVWHDDDNTEDEFVRA